MRQLTAKYEADPVKRAAIERARAKLANRIAEAKGGQKTLAAMRLSAGLSQIQLGEKLGMAQSQVARLEAGGVAVANARTIRKLREALGVTADEILDLVTEE